MPPFEHYGSWLVDGFVMTLSMVISTFNYVRWQPIVEENRLLEFAVDSGRMIIHCICDEFHISLTTQLPEFNMTLNINLRLEDRELPSGSAPEQQDPPSYFPLSNQRLVIPGVPFELPCPLCSCPLERGQVCDHNETGQVVIWWYTPDLTVEDLTVNPFSIHKIIWADSPVLLKQVFPELVESPTSHIFPMFSPSTTPPPSPLLSSLSHHAYFDARDSSESPPLWQGEFFEHYRSGQPQYGLGRAPHQSSAWGRSSSSHGHGTLLRTVPGETPNLSAQQEVLAGMLSGVQHLEEPLRRRRRGRARRGPPGPFIPVSQPGLP